MDDTKGLRGLLAAVVFQAIDDHRDNKYRKETRAFIKSEDFFWLWETLSTDLTGMPHVTEARELILTGKVVIPRKAYHARWANN